MVELLDDKDQVILQLTSSAIRQAIAKFENQQKATMENGDESGPWKASVAEGFTAL